MSSAAGRRKQTVRSVIGRSVVIETLLMLAVIGALVTALAAYGDATNEADEARIDLVSLHELRLQTLELETGLRGFYIVQREEFLEPYSRSIARVDDAIAGVEASFPGDERVALVRQQITEWRERFAEPILGWLVDGQRDRAAFAFGTGEGRRRIDAIRVLIDDLADDVRARVASSSDEVEDLTLVVIAMAAAGGVLFLLVSAMLIRRLDRAVTQPLRDLASTAERLGGGDLQARSSASGLAEVDIVATALDDMAEKLEATVEELRSLDRLKSEFVSVVSHELRTPLTSIRGSLGLLDGGAFGALPPDAAEMIDIAVTNTDRLIRLINDILDLERIEAGREAFDPHDVITTELVRQTADGLAGAAESCGVALVVGATDGVVHCDRDRMVQALTNLVGNAIKFSDAGDTVTIDARADGDEVVFRVQDEGRGIPRDALQSIFERFSQVDASDARELGGTGLGLAIVRSIAERHGGRVDVTSTVGVGSTFSIVVPRSRSGATVTVVPEIEQPASDGGALVLVVEDDPDLRRVIRAQLGRHGLRVVEASSAETALERCREDEPDLLVLDVRLDGGREDGFDLVNRLRRHDRLRTLPTVVYTAYPLSELEIDGLRLGETRLVLKEEGGPDALEATVLDLLGG